MADRAITEISLKDVRKLIEDKNIGEDVADTVGTILGVVLALAPAVAGPAALPLWALIEPKNELIEAVKSAARKISRSKPSDYLDRAERMAAANCLLVYVALFDAVRQRWPSIIRELGLTQEEARTALAEANARARPISDESVTDLAVKIPHPADRSLSSERARRAIYLWLATRFLLDALPETGHQRDREAMGARDGWTVDIMDRAEALYQAEYLGMAVEFQQFFIWSVLQDQVAGQEQIRHLAGDQRTWFELISRAMYSLDLGMQGLAEAIARLPRPVFGDTALTGTGQTNVQAVAKGLHRTYADVLQQQVIDDQFAVDDAGARLGFPRKIDGFIPQAYRIAQYDDKDMHLEDEDGWSAREVHGDIGAFILRYLESPYSVQTPLLILGHPGSGKSLLTEMLAGHLGYPAYTTVRVKLRDVDPDVGLLTQLKTQIQEGTGGRSIEWADFAEGLSMYPPVVILDGYDELLQATGKVFASYLDEVRLFQHQQAVQDRPVRVIVTSRLTLIDKAAVPLGTTVVKLEEFDRQRRDAWCEVWNKENKAYFSQNGIRTFAIPDNEKLLELARQPLLLLMLAIYDSLDNELSGQPDIDQTLLYDRLLRRFIQRELAKGKAGHEFAAGPDADRKAAVDREMDRLGVAAIGMFSRQDVKIRREDLNADIRYFDVGKDAGADGRVLTEAEVLLGSFFFIHESRSRLQQEPAEPAAGSVAFEFLHNTFGEFLAADFILRRAVNEAQVICDLTGNPNLEATRRERLERLSEGWFGALLHTPLHTRPVILDMIRQWGRHRLGDRQRSCSQVLDALDAITAAQLRVVLNDMAIPDPDPGRRGLSPYPALPRRGHLAIYSLNLVLLRAYLGGDEEYILAESALDEWAGACRPWDALANLWRSWFTLESLGALAQALTATRRGQLIVIVPAQSELAQGTGSPLTDLYRSAVALADQVTAASVGLHIASFARMPENIFKAFWKEFGDAIPELETVAAVLRLRMYAMDGNELAAPADGSRDADLPLSLDLLRAGAEVAFDFADTVARLAQTPLQRRRVDVIDDELSTLGYLSRYEAEAAVDARARLDPDWLGGLLASGRERGTWEDFVRSPAAAPVLRAAARGLDRRKSGLTIAAAWRPSPDGAIEVIDIDTASALAVLCHLGGGTDMCARLLDVIVEKCDQGAWHLLDIPVQTWEGLADLFRSPDPVIGACKARFLVLLESAVAEALSSVADGDDIRGMDALAHFWAQALRIGAVNDQERILHTTDLWVGLSSGDLTARDGMCLMSLFGWAREVGNPSLVLRLMRSAENAEGSAWLDLFFGPSADDWSPEAVDDADVARLLTHSQAMDLRWALEVLQQAAEEEARAPEARLDKRRRS
jgi:hypothetical protein